MRENNITIQLQLDLAAQKVLHHLQLTNEEVGKSIEAGIKKAIENFDFETEVAAAATHAMRESIRKNASWGTLSVLAEQKASEIVNQIMEKKFEKIQKAMEDL